MWARATKTKTKTRATIDFVSELFPKGRKFFQRLFQLLRQVRLFGNQTFGMGSWFGFGVRDYGQGFRVKGQGLRFRYKGSSSGSTFGIGQGSRVKG